MNKFILNILRDGFVDFVFKKYPDIESIVSKESLKCDVNNWFDGCDDEHAENKSGIPDENELNKMTLVDLRKLAVDLGIKKSGLKANVINAILSKRRGVRNTNKIDTFFDRKTFELITNEDGTIYDPVNKLVYNSDKVVVGYYVDYPSVVLPLTREKIEFCRSELLEYVIPINLDAF